MSARQRRREERNKLDVEGGGFEADRMADLETLESNEGRTRELVSKIHFGLCEKNRDVKKRARGWVTNFSLWSLAVGLFVGLRSAVPLR